MTEQNQDGTQRIFISEVQRHQARYRKLIQFTHSSTKAAGAMRAGFHTVDEKGFAYRNFFASGRIRAEPGTSTLD